MRVGWGQGRESLEGVVVWGLGVWRDTHKKQFERDDIEDLMAWSSTIISSYVNRGL